MSLGVQAMKGQPYPLGVTVDERGANFAVRSGIAEAVEVCLFDGDGEQERVELAERTAHVWHGLLPGVGVGQRYGLRIQGPWDPGRGWRCNPAKLLLDPHAAAIGGRSHGVRRYSGIASTIRPGATTPTPPPTAPLRHHRLGLRLDGRPAAWPPPRRDDHLRGARQGHHTCVTLACRRTLRGTYAGLAPPAVVEYLIISGSP